MSNGNCPKGIKNETNIKGLQDDITSVMDWIRRLEAKLDKILETAMKRPGWAVCAIISILMGAVAVLATLLAALGG